MTYIENILVCLTAPLLLSLFFLTGKQRQFVVFFLGGMGICLLSAYVNSFFVHMYQADAAVAAIEIAPVCEEIMKLLPILFFLLVFEPGRLDVISGSIAIGVGFATFENCCYITENGAADILFLLIRGFGAGSMHMVCGAIVGYGLVRIWQYGWLKITGTFGNLCIVITFHGVYNLLITAGGMVQIFGYLMPMVTVLFMVILRKIFFQKVRSEELRGSMK